MELSSFSEESDGVGEEKEQVSNSQPLGEYPPTCKEPNAQSQDFTICPICSEKGKPKEI